MASRLLWTGIVLLAQACAWAQTSQADKELIEKLLARIDSLEKRVAELEKSRAAPGLPAEPQPQAALPAGAAAIHMEHETPPVPEAAQQSYPLLKITTPPAIYAAPRAVSASRLCSRRTAASKKASSCCT